MVTRLLRILACAFAIGACSSFGENESANAGDAGTAPAESLAGEGEFETTGGTCTGDWTGYRAALASVAPGRESAGACRVCALSSEEGYDIYATNTRIDLSRAPVGTKLVGRAWLRTASPSLIRNADVHFSYRLGDDTERREKSAVGPLTDAWQSRSVTFVVPAETRQLQFSVHAQVGEGACFDMDGVVVEKLP